MNGDGGNKFKFHLLERMKTIVGRVGSFERL